ncbi:C-type lectin domain family 10 member A-like [Anabas testudineus]|uniref:C-type lectin domain family 10 member A-like n=1 Tax=Anabas testudineus TaxID=64144 RepID=UPI000E464B8D|nr:C-type lectin domain family 10 member A-like [Anabas testudineus]
MTDTVTEYINFYLDNIIPTRTVRCFSKNKPWINCSLKELLNRKKKAFLAGDKHRMKMVQRELKVRLRESSISVFNKLFELSSESGLSLAMGSFIKLVTTGEKIEVVEGYTNLGVHVDNRLDWKYNTEYFYRKEQNHNSVRDADDKLSTIKTNLTELLQATQIKLSFLTEERNELKTNLTELTAMHNRLQCLFGQNKTCPDGWTKSCWSCYFLSTESGSWTTGRANCRTRGADLVVIDSAEEQTLLSKLINEDTWIGLNDREKEGTWKWVDGTPLTVTYWAPTQPDNGDGYIKVGEENCAHIYGGQSSNWNDISCEASRPWICEKTPQP